MDTDDKREGSGLTVAYLEKIRADMDRLGIVLDADGERGYEALLEAARNAGATGKEEA